jgi:hypothetical protein
MRSRIRDVLTTRSKGAPDSTPGINHGDNGQLRQSTLFGTLSRLAGRSKLEIGIHLTNDGYGYRNLDRVHGTLVVKPICDTPFEGVEIAFVGASHTYIERVGGHNLRTDISRASHEFVNTVQTHVDQHFPNDRILRAGKTYTFPIDLTIPDSIGWVTCRHSVNSVTVRDAHSHLPPTFGDCGLLDVGVEDNDASCRGATVRYRIRATITKRICHKGRAITLPVTLCEHAIRLLPTYGHPLPVSMDLIREDHHEHAYRMYKTHQFKHWLQSRCLGTLTVATPRVPTLSIPLLGAKISPGDHTIALTVHLHYRSDHASTGLPHLNKIVSKLKSYTYYSTSSYEDFPARSDSKQDASKRLWGKTIRLASRDVGSIPWSIESLDDPEVLSDDFGRTERSVSVQECLTPVPTITTRSSHFVSKLTIPVEILQTGRIIPTFHSCLIGHFHELALSLSFDLNGLKKDVKLRMPLHIASSSEEGMDP